MCGFNRNIIVNFSWVFLTLAIFSTETIAQTEKIIEYRYDGSGNLIEIVTQSQSGMPIISDISPAFINIGNSTFVTVEGENLLAVDVVTDVEGITVSNVQSDFDRLTFRLTANSQAQIGETSLEFINKIGRASRAFFIAEPSPRLTSNPNPIVLLANATTENIEFVFSIPRMEQEQYFVGLSDTQIVEANINELVVQQNESVTSLQLIGNQVGATILSIEQPERFFFYTFPVFVSQSFTDFLALFEDDPQEYQRLTNNNIFSKPVGVVVRSNSDLRQSSFSQSVGISLGQQFGSYFSQKLGVLRSDSSFFFGKAVGVSLDDGNNVFGSQTEAVIGPVLSRLEPTTLSVSGTRVLTIFGVNLQEVNSATLAMPDGVTVDSFLTNNDGDQLTLTLTISADTSLGEKTIILTTTSGANVLNRNGTSLNFTLESM